MSKTLEELKKEAQKLIDEKNNERKVQLIAEGMDRISELKNRIASIEKDIERIGSEDYKFSSGDEGARRF